jgi:hypothetical protein
MKFPLYRRVNANAQLMDFNCVPFAEEMLYSPLNNSKPPSVPTPGQ